MEVLLTVTLLSVMLVILLYLSAWFSGAETAITNLTPAQMVRIQRDGGKNAQYVVQLKKDLDRTIVTILIGNNLVNILMSSLAAVIANELFHTLGVTIAVGTITFLIVVFAEITPKSNALYNGEVIALRNARTLYYLGVVLRPVVGLFIRMSTAIIRMMGGKTTRSHLLVTDDYIRDLATYGEQEGSILPIEKSIIHRVFRFGDGKTGR